MKFVIIGAGPAGVTAAETVRARDHVAEMVILTSEPFPPYSRPAMVRHFLTGSDDPFWRTVDWSTRLNADFRTDVEVADLDPEAHRILLSDGSTESYDRLVIATGAGLHEPPVGANLPGVTDFKSLMAAEDLIGRVRGGQVETVVVVGAGFIGIEVALLLNQLGVKVTQIDRLGRVMSSTLDEETAGTVHDAIRAHGIALHLEAEAEAFVGAERATGVLLSSGRVLEADGIVVATGERPRLEPFKKSGIARDRGLFVDEHLKTSFDDVYAAGDVVQSVDRHSGERVVHATFSNAIEQGRVAGLNAAGQVTHYEGAERVFHLAHLDPPILVAGLNEGDEVLRAKEGDALRTLYLKNDVLVGFQLVGDMRSSRALRMLVNRHHDVRKIKSRLLEPDFGQGVVVGTDD